MHGPYTAQISIDQQTPVVFDETEIREGQRTAQRFYQDATPAIAEGALRSAVFTVALLLEPGQQATIRIFGRTGTEGRDARPQEWKMATARREDDGSFVSSLGSRFGERVFVGV